MKRTCLTASAVVALLAAGAASATASTTRFVARSARSTGAGASKSKCLLDLAVQVPRGSVAVVQGTPDGKDYGSIRCGRLLGSGVQADSFRTDAAGVVHGRYQQYFNTGTLYGDYTLVPKSSGPPSASSFASSTLTGKIVVKNGTGAYRNMAGTGTLKCSSPDTIHFFCTERIRLG